MSAVLFVCRHNAGRSQMSAALFERAAAGRHRGLSAGSEADPGGRVHPEVVEVMRELGVDRAGRRPQRLTTALAEQADYLDWELPDPKGRPIEEARTTRDDIARRVAELARELDA